MSDPSANPTTSPTASATADAATGTAPAAPPVIPPPVITPATPPTTLADGEYGRAVATFAATAGIDATRVQQAFEKIAGAPSANALKALRDPEAATDTDFIGQLSEFPGARVRMALKELRGTTTQPAQQQSATVNGPMATFGMAILPDLPADDEALTKALAAEGLSKVGASHVVAAVRGVFANKTGMLNIPKTIAERLDQRLIDLQEPAGSAYRAVMKALRKQKFYDELAAVSEEFRGLEVPSRAHQERLLNNVERVLIPNLRAFHEKAIAWRASTVGTVGGAGGMMAFSPLMLGMPGMNPRMAALAGSSNTVNADPVRVSARALNESVNKVFAGLGIETAIHLRESALHYAGLLDLPDLLRIFGVSDKVELIKLLGLADSSTQQNEQALAKYTLAVMNFDTKTTPGTDHEAFYIAQMLQLGEEITWDNLFPEVRSPDSIGSSGPSARRNGGGTDRRNALG